MTDARVFEENTLLHRLPAEERLRLLPGLEVLDLKLGVVAVAQGRPVEFLFFPFNGSLLSLVRQLEGGGTVEVGVAGGEGFAPVASFLDPNACLDAVVVQGEGKFLRVPINEFRSATLALGDFNLDVMRYVGNFLNQVAQTAVCNRLHSLEDRLSRWLLMAAERMLGRELQLTQEFLSHMLGTRIAGVNEAIKSLEQSALIRHSRQRIEILDRPGLEAASCECFGVISREYARTRTM